MAKLNPHIIYTAYMVLVALWLGSLAAAPLFAMWSQQETANLLYATHARFCHELLTRSFCFFTDGNDIWLGDCVPDNETVIGPLNPATGRPYTSFTKGAAGYAFAECARNTSVYLAMLVGGLAFLFLRKIDETEIPPPLWFIIALIPIGVDGITQLIGFRESTNYLRFVTGFIAGFAVPFYLLPILNTLLGGKKK